MGRMKTSGPRQELIDWLSRVVEQSGLPIKTFAAKAGVGQSSISQILSGKRGVSREMIEKIAYASVQADGGNEDQYNHLVREGVNAAQGSVDGDRERGPIESIVEEAGHSSAELSPDELEDLRDDVEDFVRVRLGRIKREKDGG